MAHHAHSRPRTYERPRKSPYTIFQERRWPVCDHGRFEAVQKPRITATDGSRRGEDFGIGTNVSEFWRIRLQESFAPFEALEGAAPSQTSFGGERASDPSAASWWRRLRAFRRSWLIGGANTK